MKVIYIKDTMGMEFEYAEIYTVSLLITIIYKRSLLNAHLKQNACRLPLL